MDTEVAIDRFLASPALSDATRRAYRADLRDFAAWLAERGVELDDVDVRVLADYTAELGRARRGLAPTTIGRRLSAVRSLIRYALGPERVPEAALAPRRPRRLPETPRLGEVESAVDRLSGDDPLALRNAALVELVYACGLRSAEAVGLDLADVDLDREQVHVRGKGGKERIVPVGEEAVVAARPLAPRWAFAPRSRRVRRALPLDPRTPARHELAPPALPSSAQPPPRVRDAPAGGRRRPPHDPGAPRPRLALDDADLQPRGRSAAPARLRPGTSAVVRWSQDGVRHRALSSPTCGRGRSHRFGAIGSRSVVPPGKRNPCSAACGADWHTTGTGAPLTQNGV